MKKIIAMATVFALMLASLGGCGKGGGSTAKSNQEEVSNTVESTGEISADAEKDREDTAEGRIDEIHVGIQSNIESLSPFSISGLAGGYVVNTLYETLGGYQGFGGDFKGMAMKSWEVQEDGFTWKIELYDNITDTAGNHITTSDIKFFYDTAKANADANMSYIDELNIIDDYNFEMVLNVRQSGRFERICTGFYVFSQTAYEASEDEMVATPVGTTPYRLTDYISGSSLTFEKTDSYWQNAEDALFGLSNVDKIVFHIIPEAAQMAIALETGTIDIAENLNASESERLEGEGYTIETTDAHLCYSLLYNCDAEYGMFADNLEFRQAIAYAINRQDIIAAVASGYGSELKNFGSGNYNDFQDEWNNNDYYSYNEEKAKELLAASGYNGETVRILVSSGEVAKNAATVIQGYLLAIGVDATIDAQDNNLFNNSKTDAAAWDLILDTKADQAYMIGLIRNNFDRNNFSNGKTFNFLVDDTLQELVDTASDEAGHTDENMKIVGDYIADNCYGIGLFVLKNFYACNEKVTGLVFDQWDAVVPGCCTYAD